MTPHEKVSFAGLLVAIMTSVLISETIAWAMARSPRHGEDLRILVSASTDLREVLSLAEGAHLASESARAVLHAHRVELLVLESGVAPPNRLSTSDLQLANAALDAGETRGDRNGLTIPLTGPSGAIAVAVAYGVSHDPVTDQLLRLLSTEFGGRLEQLRLLEALGEQSLRDALTGVGSRRHADAMVEGLQPGDSLLMIDVDHFKDVNDARGDEFLVRLHTHDGDALEIARRLLDSWIALGDVPAFSVGIARHARGSEPQATFAEADRALYLSKNEGRARIEVAST